MLFGGQGRDKPEASLLVWEDTDHPGSPAYFFMEALQAIGRTYALSMLLVKRERLKSIDQLAMRLFQGIPRSA